MLFCEDQYYNKNNAFRISVSFTLAIILHLALVYYTPQIHLQNKLSADILSLPTNVSVRFTAPPKPQQTIKKAPVAKPQTVEENTPRIVPQKTVTKKVLAERPQNLNRIEPVAAPPQTIDFEKDPPKQRQITNVHPADNIIPVVKEPNIKGRRVQPQYPKRALRMGQEGVVWVQRLAADPLQEALEAALRREQRHVQRRRLSALLDGRRHVRAHGGRRRADELLH